jgi:hypothetical protein
MLNNLNTIKPLMEIKDLKYKYHEMLGHNNKKATHQQFTFKDAQVT